MAPRKTAVAEDASEEAPDTSTEETEEEVEETAESAGDTGAGEASSSTTVKGKAKGDDERTAKLEKEIAALNRTMEGLLDRSVDSTTRGDVRSEIARALKEADTETKISELTKINEALVERLEAIEKAGGISPRQSHTGIMATIHALIWGK